MKLPVKEPSTNLKLDTKKKDEEGEGPSALPRLKC